MKKENKVKNKEEAFIKKSTLKKIFIVCGSIILIELLMILIIYLKNESKINYIDTLYNIGLIDNEYYIGAGSSNYNNSKYNDKKTYTFYNENISKKENIIAEQAKFVKYDLDLNVLWEKTFTCDYDSTFYDVIKVSDGFIAVGSYIYEEKQISLKTRDGLIVKYDNDGNFKWFKNYQILGDTEFYKVIDVSDGFIAVGQSIYENNEIGNHDIGGGIIVKYDYEGNIIWKNNFGGNKSGSFNDIVSVKDGYIVVGKDGANYGLIAKFDLKGERVWAYSTYNLYVTNYSGFNAVKLYNNELYIASSVNVSDNKDEEGNPIYSFDACIYVYNLNGKYVRKYTYSGSKDEQFTNVIVNENEVVGIGYTFSSDVYDNETGMVVRFENDGKMKKSEYVGGNNHDMLTSIIMDHEDNYLVIGYSNSFGNKKDFDVLLKKITK